LSQRPSRNQGQVIFSCSTGLEYILYYVHYYYYFVRVKRSQVSVVGIATTWWRVLCSVSSRDRTLSPKLSGRLRGPPLLLVPGSFCGSMNSEA
jgi:hypothetical protein